MRMLTFLLKLFQIDILKLAGEYQITLVLRLTVTSILTADHTADTIDRYNKYIVFIIVHLSNNK